ncbi:hypothetical protein M8C21_029626 [Ambrosia artemisiifolia]|uniref:Uncharacterized protein n=1 Tax=Ambrosia artemisiifolia TaxID=4212 RepID=A0AAD5GCZ2_AMBAR|nr:hypothetical protein M8C21_029626 [Ambrosia artemisiifolia]
MERSEPTFVPEWLKSSGSLSATSHNSDEQGVLKAKRNKLLENVSDNDLGRPSGSEKTTSSYFRRASSSNGSPYLRSYGSFGRYSDKEKAESRHRDYSDPLGSILPSRFEKEGLRRSHSSLSTKRGDSWPRKVVNDSTVVNKTSHGHSNGVGLRSGGGISSVKTAFERDFPSLGAEEKQDSEIGRVPSPGLSSAIQSLPIGSSAVIGGDGWTSALAEVPVIVGSNGSNTSVVQPVQSTSISATTSMTTGRNMAETLAQGPPKAQTAPQLSVGTQRLEELAVKQSRQLIPVTPSMPKALALSSSDKQKPKVAQAQLQSSHLVNSPRPVSTKLDSTKTSTVGKLHVLKPSRERNGVTPVAKDTLSPTAGGKLPNSPLAVPSVVGPVPLRNNSPVAVPERKPGVVTLEKRPSSQAQSRSDFFNLMRKKSMAPITPENAGSSISASDKFGEAVTEGGSGGTQQSNSENKDDLARNADANVATEISSNNGRNNANSDVILYSEEEEARLLHLMGWEETADEEGLTEEEINSFYRDASKYLNLQAASKIFKGTQPKLLIPLRSQISEISSDSKLES